MPVHDRFGGIPGMPDSENGFNKEPPPQPTPEQIATFKAQLTEEATEKQAAHDKNAQETRVFLGREIRNHHLHVLFMNDQALLEARVDGAGKAEKAGSARIVLTVDIQMPTAPRDLVRHLETPPVIEAHGDSVDIHLDGHAPRMGEMGYDPARPGRVHLEFAVSNPDEIPNVTFHRTEGALFSTTPFPGREIPPLIPIEKSPEAAGIRLETAPAKGSQATGFGSHQDPAARKHPPETGAGHDHPATVPLAKEVPGAGMRIKPFFQRNARRAPVNDLVVPQAIPAVLTGPKEVPSTVIGKPSAPTVHLGGGPGPFTGPIPLSPRAQPGPARPALPPHPIPSKNGIPAPDMPAVRFRDVPAVRIDRSAAPADAKGDALPGAAVPPAPPPHEAEGIGETGIHIGMPIPLQAVDPLLKPKSPVAPDPVRPETRAFVLETGSVPGIPVLSAHGVPGKPAKADPDIPAKADPEKPAVELRGADRPLVARVAHAAGAADAGGQPPEKRALEHRRIRVESKEDVVPLPGYGAAAPHRFGSDPVLSASNPAQPGSGRADHESLAHEVVKMVDRFLVTAEEGSYVKELHMTLNPEILAGTEIQFRLVDQSLTVTFVNKDGSEAERLRDEAPELAKSLRAVVGADVEIRIETGAGRENL
jgi:hypothetical protein